MDFAKNQETLYRGTPLHESNTIRVLELARFDASIPPALSFHLRCIPLHGIIEYRALSYTWALPDIVPLETANRPETPQITCNGYLIEILPNLFDALLQLASNANSVAESTNDASTNFGLLWVDALCINQDDTAERESQVRMMGQIYASAETTIAWLGREDVDSAMAIPLMNQLYEGLLSIEYDSSNPAEIYSFNDPKFYRDTACQPLMSKQWGIINQFFRRGWFRRLWTVQEVVKAKETVFFCGDQILLLDVLVELIEFIGSQGWIWTLVRMEYDKTKRRESLWGADVLASFEALYRLKYQEPSKTNDDADSCKYLRDIFGFTDEEGFKAAKLAWLMNLSRQRQATENRDRIFAMLNLVDQYRLPNDWQALSPDYRNSEADVFVKASRFLMGKLRNLNVMSFFHDDLLHRSVDFPSWTSRCSVLEPPNSLLLNRDYPILQEWQETTPVFFIESNQHSLTLKGHRLDKIQQVGPELGSALLNSANINNLLTMAHGGYRDIHRSWITNLTITLLAGHPAEFILPILGINDIADAEAQCLDLLAALLCTEIANWHFHRGNTTRNDIQVEVWSQCHEDYAMLSAVTPELPSIAAIAHRYENLLKAFRSVKQHRQNVDGDEWVQAEFHEGVIKSNHPFMKGIEVVVPQRSLIRTSEQGLLGLASTSAQPSDEIWLLHGAKVPYVLRPKDKGNAELTYELIGEAYVEQFVDERVFEGLDLEHPQSMMLV